MAKLFDIDEYENIIRKDFSKMIDFCSRISIKDYINQMFKDSIKYENESYEVHLRDILSDIISYITNESDWIPHLQDKLKCKYSIANVLERISLLDSISDSLCKDKNKK